MLALNIRAWIYFYFFAHIMKRIKQLLSARRNERICAHPYAAPTTPRAPGPTVDVPIGVICPYSHNMHPTLLVLCELVPV